MFNNSLLRSLFDINQKLPFQIDFINTYMCYFKKVYYIYPNIINLRSFVWTIFEAIALSLSLENW